MAMRPARLGSAMRLGNARLGYYQPWLKVFIAGVDRTGGVTKGDPRTVLSSVSVTQLLNQEADQASVRVFGFTPTRGQEIKLYLGYVSSAFQIFGGHILNVKSSGFGTNVFYDLDCIDYTWLLNQRKVTKRYVGQTATAIVTDLITSFTSGFTGAGIEAAMATIDEITFTNEDVSEALTRTMERVGGYWFPDYNKDIHAFVTSTESAPSVSDASKRGAREVRQSVDLSQVVTRVLGRGGGAVTLSDCAVGQTTMPVEDPAWYSASGGTVQVGPQNITYTSVAAGSETGTATGYIGSPPSTFVLTAQVPGSLANGTYRVSVTYVTAEGETTPAAYQSITLSGANAGIFVSSIPVPTDPKVSTKRIYVSDVGGTTLKLFGSTTVAATTVAITNAGTTTAPSTNTAGFSPQATAAGSTSLGVEELSLFPSSGWAEAPGGQVFSYTGRSASSGAGTLTGIPASGIGALTADVRTGTVKAVPHLTGIPSSSAGSILYEIKRGEQVYLFVTRNDTTAQTALATYLGTGDGIREYFFSDGRLSQDELEARCDAILTERKDPLVTVTFESRDPGITVGKTIDFSLTVPPVSGTFKIQRVAITELGFDALKMRVFPKRQVELSTKRFSFEDLIRQIKLVGRPS